ncbi:hypothetical protein PIROE2DRAFT_3339, partial [Piromyces sp. E2]
TETGTCSLIDLIYSFRETINSPFPEIKSQETQRALEMLKKIKDELFLDKYFKSNAELVFEQFNDKNILFMRYWYIPEVVSFKQTKLPGYKKGISGSTIGGSNIGICKFISENNKIASSKVIKYLSSKELQKKSLIERKLYSSIKSLYDDDEVCKSIDCEFFKSHQLIGRPINKTHKYDQYSDKMRKYFYEYLYENENIITVLQKIENLTKLYQISVKTDDSVIGLIYLIVISVLSIIILSSLIVNFIQKFVPYFDFLSFEFWILSILGIIIIMFTGITEYGKLTIIKCHLKMIMLTFGFTLYTIPFLHRLVINFPEKNKISTWSQKHKYTFLFIFILIDIITNSLLFIHYYEIKDEIEIDNKNKKLDFINNVNKRFIDSNTTTSLKSYQTNTFKTISVIENEQNEDELDIKLKNVMSKIIQYHYKRSSVNIDSENSVYSSFKNH